MIQKSGKYTELTASNRPISLLKLFEKFLLLRLSTVIGKYKLIPDYQFGFRQVRNYRVDI
jgi:hypothetical protein